jgi:hypothetical protein
MLPATPHITDPYFSFAVRLRAIKPGNYWRHVNDSDQHRSYLKTADDVTQFPPTVHDTAGLTVYNKDNEVGYAIPSNVSVRQLLDQQTLPIEIDLKGIKPREISLQMGHR